MHAVMHAVLYHLVMCVHVGIFLLLLKEICEGNDHHYKHKWFDEYSHDHEAQRAMACQATPGAAMLKRGLHIFGGVKINTKHFCSDGLQSATG